MNKEIKFRVFDGEKMLFPTSLMQGGTACWRENSVIETNDNIMFYTGFKSKDGKEIYEHDVILLIDKDYDKKTEYGKELATYEHHCVKFQKGSFQIGGVNLGDFIDSKYLDIIHCGNIYENKEVYRVEEIVKCVHEYKKGSHNCIKCKEHDGYSNLCGSDYCRCVG